MSTADRHGMTGSALIEALVALVMIAIAGLLVAAAATTGLRATSRAMTLTRATALAARELAMLANRAAVAVNADSTSAAPGFADPVHVTSEVERVNGAVELAVHVEAGRPPERVSLATRVLAAE